jgi:hypothetical protein
MEMSSRAAIGRQGRPALARAMASWFGHVEPAAKDPILGVTEAFLADTSPAKLNVGVVRLPSLPHTISMSLFFCRPATMVMSLRNRAPTGTTTAGLWCSSVCVRRSGASPGTPTCEIPPLPRRHVYALFSSVSSAFLPSMGNRLVLGIDASSAHAVCTGALPFVTAHVFIWL